MRHYLQVAQARNFILMAFLHAYRTPACCLFDVYYKPTYFSAEGLKKKPIFASNA